jgi:oligosaccharide repeat unit polymerase
VGSVPDTAMWCAAFIAVAIAGTAASRALGLGRVSPVTIYFVVWAPIVLLFALHATGLAELSAQTWFILVLSASLFVVGSLMGWQLMRRIRPSCSAVPTSYDPDRLRRLYAIGLVMLAAYAALGAARQWPTISANGGLSALLSGGGLGIRRAELASSVVAAQTQFGAGSLVLGTASYVLFAGAATLIWGGYLAQRGRWLKAFLPLALLACYSIFELQRTDFIDGALLFAFSYMYYGRTRSQRTAPRRRSGGAGVAALIIVVLIVPIELRYPGLSLVQHLQSLADYAQGGVGGFNVFVHRGVRLGGPQPGYGAWSFGGLISLLARAGIPFHQAPAGSSLGFVNIGDRRFVLGNVYTYLLYCYQDLGWSGYVAGPFLLGVVASLAHYVVIIRRNITFLPVAALFLALIAQSVFSMTYVRDAQYVFLLVVAVLADRYLRPKPASATVTATPVPARLAECSQESEHSGVLIVAG